MWSLSLRLVRTPTWGLWVSIRGPEPAFFRTRLHCYVIGIHPRAEHLESLRNSFRAPWIWLNETKGPVCLAHLIILALEKCLTCRKVLNCDVSREHVIVAWIGSCFLPKDPQCPGEYLFSLGIWFNLIFSSLSGSGQRGMVFTCP